VADGRAIGRRPGYRIVNTARDGVAQRAATMGRGVRGGCGASLAFGVVEARRGDVMRVWAAAIAAGL